MTTQKQPLDPKCCSLNEAQKWLGVTRQTLSNWIDDGAPVVKRAEGKGQSTLVSVPDLYAWSVENAVKKAVAKTAPPPVSDEDAPLGAISKDEADRRRAVAEAVRAEIKAFQEAGQVVNVAEVGAAVARHLVPVRQRLMSLHRELPDKLERRTGVPARISANLIRAEVDECLTDIAKEVDLTEPENADIPDDDDGNNED